MFIIRGKGQLLFRIPTNPQSLWMNAAQMSSNPQAVSTSITHTKSASKHQPWQRASSQSRLSSQMHGIINGSEMDVEGAEGGSENGEANSRLRAQKEQCLVWFQGWNQTQQTEFAEQLIARMSFHQHEHLYAILLPMLQRDFITALPGKWWEHYRGGGGGGGGGNGFTTVIYVR